MGSFTLLDVAFIRAGLVTLAGTSDSVQRRPERVANESAIGAGQQGFAPVTVRHIVTVIVDVVLKIGRSFLADPNPPSSLF